MSVERGEQAEYKALQKLWGEECVLIMESSEVLCGWRVGKGGVRVRWGLECKILSKELQPDSGGKRKWLENFK